MPRKKKVTVVEAPAPPVEQGPKTTEQLVKEHLEAVCRQNIESGIHWRVYDQEAIGQLIDLGYSVDDANTLGPKIVTDWFEECKQLLTPKYLLNEN